MNQFENDPRLKNLMPLKRQIILELANGSHNATMEQMFPQIMQLNRELQKRNLSFSKEESNLIMDIMMEQASPAERQKICLLYTSPSPRDCS